MFRALIFSGVILIAAGCERPTVAVETGGGATLPPEQILVLNGFNQADTVVVGSEGYRVGLYHDFSPFDSLRFSFSAEQLNPGSQTAQVMIRVGPANYFRDTLLSRQEEVSINVNCATLAKPHSSAITFYAADPDGRILLTHLRVIGWTAVSGATYPQE